MNVRLFLLVLLLPRFALAQEPKKPLAIDDLYRLDAPKSPALAPDGDTLVYIRSWIDPKTKQERNSLWIVEGDKDKRRPMEEGEPDARNPVFSPDGKWIAFLSTRPNPRGWNPIPFAPPESDATVGLWLIPTAGGEAVPLAGPAKYYGRVFHDGFYGRVAFSPDGKRLVFVADDGTDPRTKEEKENHVRIVRADQGEGYTGYGPAQVWIADLKAAPEKWAAEKIHRITNDDIYYGDPQWSPDGNTLVVHANKTDDRESVRFSINKNFDLWAIDVKSGNQTQLTKEPGPDVSPRISPDGKTIAFLTVPRKGTHRDAFFLGVLFRKDNRVKVFNGPHGGGFMHPVALPGGLFGHPTFPLPDTVWADTETMAYMAEEGTRDFLNLLRVDGGSPKNLPEKAHERRERQAALLPPGNKWDSDRLLAKSEVISWKSDAFTIQGILTTPPPEVAKAPYKLLLYPHGGPHSRSTLGFDFTVQVFAAHGYAVLQPNFRGSSGYGQKFIDADRNDFGGGDFRDCMRGIDHLIDKGLVDKDRLFIFGSSYGGYMTTWSVTQTDRFRAAAAQNAVTDLNMMWALSDIQSWTEWEFEGKPWEVPEKMRKHSPLTHVAKVKTPTLILHAEKDRRVPLPMGKAFFEALLRRGVPTQMVTYPDEGHGIRQPRHREDVLRRVLAWFEKYEKE